MSLRQWTSLLTVSAMAAMFAVHSAAGNGFLGLGQSKWDTPDAYEAIYFLRRGKEASPLQREWVGRSISSVIVDDPSVAGAVLALADHESPTAREIAIRSLRHRALTDQRAAAAIVAGLNDPVPAVRKAAACSIGEIGAGGEDARTVLERRLGDSEIGVRLCAAFALQRTSSLRTRSPYRDPQLLLESKDYLLALIQSREVDRARPVLAAICSLDPNVAASLVPSLLKMRIGVASPTSRGVEIALADLGQLVPGIGKQVLEDQAMLARFDRPEDRFLALAYLRLEGDAVERTLLKVLTAGSADERAAAASSLGLVRAPSAEVRQALLEAVLTDDLRVADAAGAALIRVDKAYFDANFAQIESAKPELASDLRAIRRLVEH